MEEILRQALNAIKGIKLPELPEEVMELEIELKSRFVNTANLTRIIEKNTTLSGEVLRLINSPKMKMKMPVKTIRDAVNQLGTDNLRNLVVSAFLERFFSSSVTYRDIMAHSVDVAFCMAQLSEWVEGISRDEAYMLGLFHNAGCLMLAMKDPENYINLFNQANSNPLLAITKEQQTYGTDHCAIGVLLGKKWHLPVDLLSAIFLHHIDKCETIQKDRVRAMVALIKIANAIVSEVSLGAYRSQEMREYELDGQRDLMIESAIIKETRLALLSFNAKR